MNLTYKGHTYLNSEFTTAQAIAVAKLVGVPSWDGIDFDSGPEALSAWLVVLDAGRTGRTLEAVAEEVYALPLGELIKCLTPATKTAPTPKPKATKRTTPKRR